MTWDEFEENTNATYAGGHHTDEMLPAYRHGIATVFNVLRAAFPSGPDAMQNTERMLSALRYMADRGNWDEETGLLKRPGGGKQEGIVLYSANIVPWVFAAQFVGEATVRRVNSAADAENRQALADLQARRLGLEQKPVLTA